VLKTFLLILLKVLLLRGVDFEKVIASKDEEIAKLKEQIKKLEKVQAAAITPETFETVVASRIDAHSRQSVSALRRNMHY